MTVTEGVVVNVLPYEQYEYLMTTREVAHGYGTSLYVIRKTFLRHEPELIEGRHYIKGVDILSYPLKKGVTNTHTLPNAQPHQVFWTKAGIVRLGFFIRSERAKLFRDWAENLILSGGQPAAAALPAKRRINRLTPDRIIDILTDVCLIEDRELRERIANKITGGYSYGH